MNPLLSCCLLSLLLSYASTQAQSTPRMRFEDKVRIKEAFKIAREMGNQIWHQMDQVPFVVLLVSDSIEFLVHHPYPSNDFQLSEQDDFLSTNIFYRKRQFPEYFLATFPAVNGVNCVVVGTPEKTQKSSTEWVITLIHEHFHQYQFTQPDYYASVNQLGLSGGDETGMWQLNYPFPYTDVQVISQFEKYTTALDKAIHAIGQPGFNKAFKKYKHQRARFRQLLKPADYKYFSFQLWQEGVARHTEYSYLKAMENHQPSLEMVQLKDFVPFNELKDQLYRSEIKSLTQTKLNEAKRVSFYAVGFGEGLLLDVKQPEWRQFYLSKKFDITNCYVK